MFRVTWPWIGRIGIGQMVDVIQQGAIGDFSDIVIMKAGRNLYGVHGIDNGAATDDRRTRFECREGTYQPIRSHGAVCISGKKKPFWSHKVRCHFHGFPTGSAGMRPFQRILPFHKGECER